MKNKILVLAITTLFVPLAHAANYGTDLNNTMLPATGGMGGASVARTVENAAAVFGNPATLTQYNEGTNFTFGATFYKPKITDKHNGLTTGVAWEGESDATNYLIPTISITQALSPELVLGLGLGVTAGVGSNFRAQPGSLGPNSELLVFAANAGAGYKLTDNLSLGLMATIGNGYLQDSLSSDSSSVHGFGIRATMGAKYDMGATSIGGYYRSPLKILYDNYINDGLGNFWSDHLSQPNEYAMGVSNNSLMDGNLLISGDVIYKQWSNASFYKDFYRDQTVFALGGQLTTGKAQWRVGYSYARDPIKRGELGDNIGGNNKIGVSGTGAGQIQVNTNVIQYFQATNAEAIWENQVTLGAGYQVLEHIRADGHLAFALQNDQTIGNTKVEAQAWQAGLGLTWSFK